MHSLITQKITFVLIIVLSISGFVRGQPFYEYILKADSLSRAGFFIGADQFYDLAFQNREDVLHGFYYNAALNNLNAENYEKAIGQFTLAINKGLIDFNSILENPKLKVLKKNESWKKLKSLIGKKEEGLNRKYIAKLAVLFEKDQLFRQLNNCKDGLSNNQKEIFESLANRQDSLNVIEVANLIEANDEWLGTDLVGYQGNLTTWLVIQHANIETQERYIPLLEDSVLKGESKGEHLAMLQDRILLKKGRKQIYGTQVKRNTETGAFYVYPIENVHNINIKRKSIGLSPINEYLSRWNITIENDYNDEIE